MARPPRRKRADRRWSARGGRSPNERSPREGVLTPMGEPDGQVPPFASPAEHEIGTFWAFPRVPRVPSVLSVIRKMLSAHARGAMPRYVAAVIGAAVVYGIEQVL